MVKPKSGLSSEPVGIFPKMVIVCILLLLAYVATQVF